MPHILRKRSTRIALTATTGLLAATLGFFAWQSFYPVQAASGWDVEVLHRNVTKAASLLPQADGSLLVSRELDDGRGSILKITATGDRVVVIDNLSKPDGMVAAQGGVGVQSGRRPGSCQHVPRWSGDPPVRRRQRARPVE